MHHKLVKMSQVLDQRRKKEDVMWEKEHRKRIAKMVEQFNDIIPIMRRITEKLNRAKGRRVAVVTDPIVRREGRRVAVVPDLMFVTRPDVEFVAERIVID